VLSRAQVDYGRKQKTVPVATPAPPGVWRGHQTWALSADCSVGALRLLSAVRSGAYCLAISDPRSGVVGGALVVDARLWGMMWRMDNGIVPVMNQS